MRAIITLRVHCHWERKSSKLKWVCRRPAACILQSYMYAILVAADREASRTGRNASGLGVLYKRMYKDKKALCEIDLSFLALLH